MAVTQNTYTGNGATVLYSFTFPYLETTDVKVTINGTPTTAYTFANATTIQFNTAPANGAAIRIYRDTDDASLAATFYSGSAIRAQDLNDNFTQNLYVTQEVNNNSVNIDGSNPMVGPLNMNGFQITNLPVPAVDTNAATKKYVDDRFGNLDVPGHTRWRKVATNGQTTFSGTGDYGGVLAYSPTREQVYINGALQQRSVDYAADNGTSVVFTVGLTVGDVVDIICVNNLTNSSVSNAGNITYSGQFTGQTARTVAAKLGDVISVKDFGIGSGVTDDTTKIQTLFDQVSAAGGGEIIFDSDNNYLVSDTVYIRSNLVLRFTGSGFITLTEDTTASGGVFVAIGTSAAPIENVVIYNPRVDAGSFGYPLNDGENGIGGAKCKNIQIYGGIIKNCRRGSYSPAGAGGKGVQFEEGVENILVDGTTIRNCTIGAETGGVVDLVGPPAQFRSYRGVQYKNLRIYNCDRAISVIHSTSPLDDTPTTGLVQISNILAYNCGRESVAGTEKTFGAIVLDRASNVSMTNVCIANSSTYGDLGAVIRQPRGTNCSFDVTFIGNADALVLHSTGSTGFGGGDTCENNTYRINHIGTTGYAVSGVAGQGGAIFKNSYDMQLDVVSTGLVDPNVAFSTSRCRFLSQSKNASVEGQADVLVAAGNAFQTENHRIAGTLSISATGTDKISTNANGRPLIRHAADDNVVVLSADATSGYGANIAALLFSGYSPNNATAKYLYMVDTSTVRAEIRSNGGFANFQANDVNLSDRNVKKDITPASNTWDCIKEWEIVNYRYKDQPGDSDLNLGVIAQQIAETCPEVVTVFEAATDDKPEKLGVKEQQMYWMAIKALQEAQIRIETLENRLAVLESGA